LLRDKAFVVWLKAKPETLLVAHWQC
jgi:hypothetical protein